MKSLLLGLGLVFAGVVSLGCGEKDPGCINGNIGTCEDTCPDGGCSFVADGAGTKNYNCEGGDCDLTVTGAGTVSMDCEGGGCIVEAQGSGTVSLSCEGGGCDFTCSGTGTCILESCPTDDCAFDCTQITATCTEM